MNQPASIIPEDELYVANRRIAAFAEHFGDAHLLFACHAALPLALTPHLLYALWANFQRDSQNRVLNIPWIAVADLLVSGLLQEVGYEIYQMERVVRTVLLQGLRAEERLGQQRVSAIAQFLLAYVQPQLKSNDSDWRDLAIAQQCTALAYLRPHAAVHQLGKLYRTSGNSKTELVRMESLVTNLSAPLAAYPPLFVYARSLGNYARGKVEEAKTQLQEVRQTGNAIEVAGVSFVIPKPLLEEGETSNNPITQRKSQLLIFESKSITAPSNLTLKVFEFEILKVNVQGKMVSKTSHQAEFFSHHLGNDVALEMVAIFGGKFIMGAPDSERGSRNSERPQQEVTVPPFFMGKFLVTQAQWRVIASLPKVEQDLDPNPSRFKGDDLPVESVSWYDAVEFCQRLSGLIEGEYEYRLPSEVEWEYACRAGTTTPFYFGETITGELANYRASATYAQEPRGEYRRETTSVGSFPPNAFGLYDMHGNLWEWCADNWHENYQGAPTDGSVWEAGENDQYLLLRGGSWDSNPIVCRSAYRVSSNIRRGDIDNDIGFRVVCVAART